MPDGDRLDFKFDIRILALSLLIHFFAFGVLTFYTSKETRPNNVIDVVINDNRNEKLLIPNLKNPKEEQNKETKNSKFFSETPNTFERQTVAKEFGDLKNQQKNGKEKSQVLDVPKSPLADSPNFLPVKDTKATEDERQSTINFQVPNLAKGEMTFLNSDFSTYASFYNRITPKIVYTWGNNIDDIALFPHMREKLRKKMRWVTRVEMILTKTGHYKNIIIINSSGSDELDQAVVESLRDAGPYLNPPTGMIEEDGTVHITGEFSVYTQRPRLAY